MQNVFPPAGSKSQQVIPKNLPHYKRWLFLMIAYTTCSHHMKYLVQCTYSTRQSYHHVRFLQHNIFPVAQIHRMKCHVKQVADSSVFLQFVGITPIIIAPFLSFSCQGFHQSGIGTTVNQPLTMLPSHAPSSRAFSINTGSIASEAEQRLQFYSYISLKCHTLQISAFFEERQ